MSDSASGLTNRSPTPNQHNGQGLSLDATQLALWRAGHGHAGVLVLLALIMQPFVDATRLSRSARWVARLAVPVASLAVSGGFFGLAYVPEMRFLLYFGALSLAIGVVLTGTGLLRNR